MKTIFKDEYELSCFLRQDNSFDNDTLIYIIDGNEWKIIKDNKPEKIDYIISIDKFDDLEEMRIIHKYKPYLINVGQIYNIKGKRYLFDGIDIHEIEIITTIKGGISNG